MRPQLIQRKLISDFSKRYTHSINSESFAEVYEDLSHRLAFHKLNRANRTLAFRPRRANQLLSRKHPIIFEGKPLKPMTYRGEPGISELTKFLGLIKSDQDLQNAKNIVKDYAVYASNNIHSSHLIRYLRAAIKVGNYNSAASVILTGYEFKPIRNQSVMKEMVRIHAIRASKPHNIISVKRSLFNSWSKVPEKCRQNDINVNLAMIYGVLQLAENATEEKTKLLINSKLNGLISEFKKVLEKTEIPSSPPETGLPNDVIDLMLGQTALKKLGEDTSKIDEILKIITSPLKHPDGILDEYLALVHEGYVKEHPEMEQETSELSEPAAATA